MGLVCIRARERRGRQPRIFERSPTTTWGEVHWASIIKTIKPPGKGIIKRGIQWTCMSLPAAKHVATWNSMFLTWAFFACCSRIGCFNKHQFALKKWCLEPCNLYSAGVGLMWPRTLPSSQSSPLVSVHSGRSPLYFDTAPSAAGCSPHSIPPPMS